MEFKELTNEQWASIQPLLPPPARTGRPRADDRTVTNGILYVLASGCRWADLPPIYGSGKTAWRRYTYLRHAGVWARLIESLGY